jgi:hypothetical protein
MNLYEYWAAMPGHTFRSGVELLLQYLTKEACTRQMLVRLQSAAFGTKSPDGYLTGKLHQALRSIPYHYDADAATTETVAADADDTQPVSNTLTSPRARALHKEHSHYHALMVAAQTDQDRAYYSKHIMQRIIAALDAEYDRLRAGGLPDDAPATIAEPAAKAPVTDFQRLHSLRTRVSRIRNKLLPEATGDRLQELQQELADKLAVIAAIEQTTAR